MRRKPWSMEGSGSCRSPTAPARSGSPTSPTSAARSPARPPRDQPAPPAQEVFVPPFASEQFRAITRANPERVWTALTATGVPLDYLHDMTADTGWQPATRVTLALTGHWRLTGEVLAAERPH